MAWIYLLIAGICEAFGVLMINKLNNERNLQSLLLLIGDLVLAFHFLPFR